MIDPAAALRTVFNRLAPISDAAVAAVAALATRRAYAAGDHLLRAGDRAERCHVIVRGLVREYYATAEGAEHTRRFVAEGQVTGSLLDLLSDAPAVTWIEALEDTETVSLPYRALDELCLRHADLHLAVRRSAERLYVVKARREFEILALSAGERYAAWLGERGELDARISRRHLASYLGVTPEHLSRLARGSSPRARARRRST
jgi:CRP-like cAMP-binding protein